MAHLTVYKYLTAEGADLALEKLKSLQARNLTTIHDAAIVTWPIGKKKPQTRQAVSTLAAGALDGAFWGMLFGLIFFMPLIGVAIGAGMGALTGYFTDIGINDSFIKDVRAKVTEGTSALFLLTSNEVVDRLADEFKGMEFELVATNLSKDQEAKLHANFSAE
jgi:uncharacterized membrane protein